jgi:hypothetical protein
MTTTGGSKDDDFSTPPELSSGITVLPSMNGPTPTETDKAQAKALLEQWNLQRDMVKVRAVGAGIAFVVGILILSAVLVAGFYSAADAWSERVAFSTVGQGDRLKYVLAFLGFKAAAIGGALTVGLLLIRAANLLTGGNDASDGVAALNPTSDD